MVHLKFAKRVECMLNSWGLRVVPAGMGLWVCAAWWGRGLGDGGRGGALARPKVHPQSPGHVREAPRQREDLRLMRKDLNKGH